ncbi:MAG: tRNA (adenosine(37)-N6)-threonylcarbamoyltransferase complex dimerization subunit type 1 TsaB [Phycisphaerales bacterium]|nr:MAG: tRNA (adenosine(37)-N6)-threonylcarbamoyltransferase complex dimerization subunit type 1 TsaB [Phycisphaerales bacterium]
MTTADTAQSAFSLAFETSSALGSVALGRGGKILETRQFSTPRNHAVEFLPTIAAICEKNAVEAAAIEYVFVSAGPGSFTGLRIGVTGARMIALAGVAKLVAVPTLEVIAQNAIQMPAPPEESVVILDAKRRRVYAGAFRCQGGVYVAAGEPAELDPGEFLANRGASCAVLGEGVHYHLAAVEASGLTVLPEHLFAPRAEMVFQLGLQRAKRGELAKPSEFTPIYVRPPEAEEKWQQRQGGTPP